MFQLVQASNKYKLSLLAASVAAAMTSQTVFAEEAQDEVVETAMIQIEGQATSGLDSLILSEDLEKLAASDLSEIFKLNPQINAGGGTQMGQKLYLRNIGEDALNISVDGAEQAGGIFHHSGRVAVEPDLLKQVEVEAGPGSATAGFGALGGSVRFVTKDPIEMLAPGESTGALIKGTYFSNTEGYKGTTSVFGRDSGEVLSFLASFVRSEHNNLEDGNGDEVFGTDTSQRMSYVKLVAQLSDEQKVAVSYEHLSEAGDMPYRTEWAVSGFNPVRATEGTRKTAVLNYEFDANTNDWLDLMINVYKTDNEQLRENVFRGTPAVNVGEMSTYGFTLQNTSLVANHKLIYGVNYRDDESVFRNELDSSEDGQETGKAQAVYLQDVIDVTDDLVVSTGVRFDDYEVDEASQTLSDDGLSPNLSANYDITSNLSVSAGYSQAFRGPEVKDAYRVYLGGPQSDSNLDGETSKNIEAGFDFSYENFGLSAGAYVLKIEDGIFYNSATRAYGNLQDDLETKGFYVEADYFWNGLTAIVSYHSADTSVGNQDAFRYITGSTGTSIGDKVIADVSYEFNDDLLVGWTGEFVQGMDISVSPEWYDPRWPIQDFHKAGYGVHDLYARWLPTSDEDLSLTLTVKNVLDKQYLDHASAEDLQNSPDYAGIVGQAEAGRDIRLTAALRI
jgi:hemoglobin/transferrin/lactoferrin receptor protein